MWKHKNFINLQLCAAPALAFPIYVNGEKISISGESTWEVNAEHNTNNYTISGNNVIWKDGTILQYNGVDVLPTDSPILDGQYTTRSASTLKFKHLTDVGTIGTGTYKFRRFAQGGAGETWLLDEQVEALSLVSTNVSFISNGNSYTWINARKGYIAYSNSELWDDANMVYDTVSWSNQAYRTVTFLIPPTGDLLTWLQNNGTKQGGGGASN